MFRSIFNRLYTFGVSVANIGVSGEPDFHEKTKTQVMNLVLATGLPINIFFATLNFVQHKILLSGINFLLFIGGILILFINSRRKFLLSRSLLTFLACVLFTAEAVLFRNGGEYYLVANLIIIIIYFNEKKYLVAISIVSCLLFIGVKIFLTSSYVYDTVPFGRIIFNICWALITTTVALLFFKTEQISYQKQIEEKNGELQRLNDTKEKLFSIIAHDLRSPIGQLKNALDLVNKEYLSPEKFQEISARLSVEVGQLHSTLDNLLRWSLGQFQGIKVNPEKTALAGVLAKKMSLFKQNIEQKNLTIQLEGAEQFILVDPDHLLLILRNLFSNAIKYSYPGSTILIRAQAKEQKVIIEVIDEGIGMSADIVTSIFSPETTLSKNGTANEKGTGLGLKLCKEFIEKNQGSIWVESREKSGSSFYISLPEAQ
jgi:signal transduction histidine kinase